MYSVHHFVTEDQQRSSHFLYF